METALATCAYCKTAFPLAGSLYCCEGCESLAGLTGERELPAADAEDARLARDYGKKIGDRVEFTCAVEPFACEACLQALAKLPENFPAVQELEWNRSQSVLRFQFAANETLPSALFELLRRLKLQPRWVEPGETLEQDRLSRARLIRAGVTGALAGNIMMFAVPIYGGLEGALRVTFEWIQAALFLPVFFWCALPIFRAAAMSARLKHLSVDTPLAFAFVMGAVFSYVELLAGGHNIYFDSLAGFLFLILASRYVLEKSLANHLRAPKLGELFETPHFSVVRGGTECFLPWHALRAGDEVTLAAGDRLPVDASLCSRSAEFDSSWMTGEAAPVLRLKGSPLQAGTRLVSKSAVIQATSDARSTDFARIVERLATGDEKLENGIEARVGSALVLACLMLIAGMALLAPQLGIAEIFRRGLALLIVACPCAISFAAPLARARATRIARSVGFWVKRPHVWSRLARPEKIAFDKTGTLTEGNLSIAPHSPMMDVRWKQIILSLENISAHPVAESLRRSWGPLGLYPVEKAREIPGEGVEGVIEGQFYEFKKDPGAADDLRLVLRRNGLRLTEIELQDQVRAGTKTAFENLGRNHRLYIVSGDNDERVRAFAESVRVPPDRASGALKPEEKARVLDEIKPDLYFGDGTNDVPALKRAPVSFATGGAALEAKAAADVLMLDANLAQLPRLFEIGRETESLIHRNFAIALAYNVAAGAAAVLGFVHPLVAALLMPTISLLLAASTLWGTRGLRRAEGIA